MNTENSYFPDFRPAKTILSSYFTSRVQSPCDIILSSEEIITNTGRSLPHSEYDEIAQGVWMHISAYMAPDVKITPPSIICKGARLSHGSIILSSVIGQFSNIGENSVICNSIIFDLVRILQCVSISSSVIGYNSIIGAGAVLCDTNQNHETIRIHYPGGIFYAYTNKMGAFVGACSRIGENSVISPGSVISSHGTVHPLTYVSGYVPPKRSC